MRKSKQTKTIKVQQTYVEYMYKLNLYI